MLSVKQLNKSYKTGRNSVHVLKGVSFDVEEGEFVAVMGASGSGKTTLLNCISCYISSDSGSILLGNTDLASLDEDSIAKVRNRKLGFVFQDFLLLDGLTVEENIMMPIIISGKTDAQMESSARSLCEIFGISHIKDKYPAEISGGEKQRTAVARALINNPMLILADEPTGNLDSKSTNAVIDAFLQAKKTLSSTILMVTHDSYAASYCDRVIMLKDGKVWKTYSKENQDRRSFHDRLLSALGEMSDGTAESCTGSQKTGSDAESICSKSPRSIGSSDATHAESPKPTGAADATDTDSQQTNAIPSSASDIEVMDK